MGKTIPAYRMALEIEIEKWKGFKKALIGEEDKEAFEELIDICRGNAMASGNACNPIIFEPMVMSILVAQQKKRQELEHKLNQVLSKNTCNQENKPTNPDNPKETPPPIKNN